MPKLSAIRASVAQDEVGKVVAITDPDGEPYQTKDGIATTFTVVGKQSTKYKLVEDAASKKMINGQRITEPGELRQLRIDKAAACVVAMSGWEAEDDSLIPYSVANVKEILAADERILEQVENARDKHSSFLSSKSPLSSNTSSTTNS